MSETLTFSVSTDISHIRPSAQYPATPHHSIRLPDKPTPLPTPPSSSLLLSFTPLSPSTSQLCSLTLKCIALCAITRRRISATSSAAIGIRVGKLCSRPPRRIVSAETSRLNISRNTRAVRQRDPAPAAIVRNIVDSSSWCASASVIGLRRGCQLCGWKERHIYVPGRQLPEERR